MIYYFSAFYVTSLIGFLAGDGIYPSRNFYNFVLNFGKYALFSPESSSGLYDFSYTIGFGIDDFYICSFSLYSPFFDKS